jgi:hypothetical protein
MSGAGTDHPLVRDYLRELDTALAALPAGQAHELREQITAHIDDALGPEAGEHDVTGVLRQLGSPETLAAEAAAGASRAPRANRAGRRLLARLRQLGWRGRAALAATVIVAGGMVGYVASAETAAPLSFDGLATWWYPRDYNREVFTEADGAEQVTVPIRSGQQQGFAVNIVNSGDWTQTVLGTAPNTVSPGGLDFRISVATTDPDHGGGNVHDRSYTLPGSIPPHQERVLRMMWTSTSCIARGGSQGIDKLVLRVRVGLLTRTEVINLTQGWFLSGPSHGHCG